MDKPFYIYRVEQIFPSWYDTGEIERYGPFFRWPRHAKEFLGRVSNPDSPHCWPKEEWHPFSHVSTATPHIRKYEVLFDTEVS